jgi:hypothetical protein
MAININIQPPAPPFSPLDDLPKDFFLLEDDLSLSLGFFMDQLEIIACSSNGEDVFSGLPRKLTLGLQNG